MTSAYLSLRGIVSYSLPGVHFLALNIAQMTLLLLSLLESDRWGYVPGYLLSSCDTLILDRATKQTLCAV